MADLVPVNESGVKDAKKCQYAYKTSSSTIFKIYKRNYLNQCPLNFPLLLMESILQTSVHLYL
jgi:hypothetical protein